MTDCPKSVEEMAQRMREHWNQPNLDAGFTALRLYRARDLLFGRARDILEQYQLSPGEFDALASLRKVGPPYELTPSDICQVNLVTSGGLTKVLNSLEERGYVTREQNDEDLRSRIVKLSRKGKVLIEGALAEVLASHEQALSGAYTRKERDELDRLLAKLIVAGAR